MTRRPIEFTMAVGESVTTKEIRTKIGNYLEEVNQSRKGKFDFKINPRPPQQDEQEEDDDDEYIEPFLTYTTNKANVDVIT